MATNFPNSPSNGATHAGFTYNSTTGAWESSGGGGGGAGVTVYANFAAFPASPSEGDLAYANDTDALYVRKGSSWNRIDSGEEAPVILTEPPTATQNLAIDGTTKVITMTAQDPEGFGITYGIAYATANNARPTQLSSDTTINQSTGAYTFTPSTTQAHAGNFKARLSASDGANTTTRLVNFSLNFNMPTTYLIVAGGGGGGAGVAAGGGGAGGLLYSTSGSFPLDTAMSVVVGAGGAGSVGNGDGNTGSNSTVSASGFTTLTADGGGAGGGMRTSGAATASDLAGGSGGGGTGYSPNTITGPGGTATSGQGNAGGTGRYLGGPGYGGGGGGAGEAGGNHDDSTDASVGGDGAQYSISGTATYYAGGGGGGGYNSAGKAGGQGGGGQAGHRYGGGGASSNATANTGGGGGGAGDGGTGGAGGSGIVILRGPNTYSASGSGYTETTSGSDKIWTFTGNGTITFSS